MCLAGTAVAWWSLTQEVEGSNLFTVVTNIYWPQGEGNIFRSICLSTGGVYVYYCLLGVCLLGGVPTSAYLAVCLLGGLCLGGAWMEPPGATAVVGTHPTGMHSCSPANSVKTFRKTPLKVQIAQELKDWKRNISGDCWTPSGTFTSII